MSELKLGALWLTFPDMRFKRAPFGDAVDFEELIHEFNDCFMFILYNMHYDDWYPQLAEVEWEALNTSYAEMRDLCWVIFEYLNSTKFRRWRTYAGMTYDHAVMKFNAMTGDKYPCGRRNKVKRSPVLVDFDSPDADEDLRPKRFQRTYDGEDDDDIPQGPSTYHNPLKRNVTSLEANVPEPYQPDFDSVPIEYDDEGWAEAEAGQMSHGYYEGEYYKKLGSLNNSPAYVNFLRGRAEPILKRAKKATVNRHKLPIWITNPAIQPTIPMAFKKARSLFYIDLTDDDRDWANPTRYSPVEIWEDEIIRDVDGDDHFDVYMGDGSDDCCVIENLNSLPMDIEPENPVEEATQVDPSLSSVTASTIASAQRRQQEEDDEDLGLVYHGLQTNPDWQAQIMNEQLETGEIQVPDFDDPDDTPESYMVGSDPLSWSDI